MRLIVHVDADGQAKLLQRATLMWKEGARDPITGRVTQEGRYVIVTTDNPAVVSRFSGAALVDGVPVGRRVSSICFSHKNPVSSGSGAQFAVPGTPGLIFNLVLEADDPLNPFRHVYHPDHDSAEESFRITRKIELEFTESDPEAFDLVGRQDKYLGGIYRETLTGLYSRYIPGVDKTIDAIAVAGVFRLHRVSRIAVLNDGIPVP
jgi:hypothetical protein